MNIRIDPEKCSGCKLCEIACSMQHSNSINPSKSRIKVFIFDTFSLPVIAGPYTDAACNSKFKIVMNGEEIDGCMLCRASCPTKTIFQEPGINIPLKCDFCGDPPNPQCVKWCPSKALLLEE